ncbi:MAG: NAD(+)/NADH kinase [Mariprofundus sp.]|nr:NAD(+)/NADH kinase [Mariprofundus sp.]
MKSVGLSIKPNDARACALLSELHGWLIKKELNVFVDQGLAVDSGCPKGCSQLPVAAMAETVDLMIILGGDGTLLHAARFFVGSEVPILGINLGRLGFLTDTPVGSMFEVVEDVLRGNVKTIHHFTLHAEVWRAGQKLAEGNAMNDVVLERSAVPRMIGFEMAVKGKFVFRMRGDALILATPAGSTAYALSAGGPIVHPAVNAISVVPVCPHTLSNRPIVISANDAVELNLVESRHGAAVNLDGEELLQLQQGDQVRVCKGGFVSLVHQPDRHYFEGLRSKLHWAGQLEVD